MTVQSSEKPTIVPASRFGVAIHADEGLSVTAVTFDRGSDRTVTHTLEPGQTLADWLSKVLA